MTALFLLAFPAHAETLFCTQMWCQEGLTINLENKKAWQKGEYKFVMMLDDKSITCKGSLPFKGCDTPAVTCDGEGVTIGESGCALPPDAHSFNSIMVPEAPKQVMIDIVAPNGKKFKFDRPVEAQCSYPNGEDCDLRECCSAVYEAAVKFQ